MKLTLKHGPALLVAATLAAMPVPAMAQSNTTTTDSTTTSYNTTDQDNDRDHKDFPWGLLGLLGLGGLLGLKRRDDVRDVHVDARRDKRP